jgi:hypothetical protein
MSASRRVPVPKEQWDLSYAEWLRSKGVQLPHAADKLKPLEQYNWLTPGAADASLRICAACNIALTVKKQQRDLPDEDPAALRPSKHARLEGSATAVSAAGVSTPLKDSTAAAGNIQETPKNLIRWVTMRSS